MNTLSWILLALVAAAFAVALRHIFKKRKQALGCSGCAGGCASNTACAEKEQVIHFHGFPH
ncbi:MAG TPA: FeoB-associated Cys-rich membrane protein [Candidatus Aphodousia gallistercoris]|nr:FeoB-associated Cys-rich membrane protein [Candidatus Aphodousia gallistercoris]